MTCSIPSNKKKRLLTTIINVTFPIFLIFISCKLFNKKKTFSFKKIELSLFQFKHPTYKDNKGKSYA